MNNKKTLEMVQLSVLMAIILIMAFTPLGYLKTVGLEISLLTIPVVIGAMVMGPKAGAILGLVFGLTSFYQCFGMSWFGAQLLNINPFFTFIVCVPTRTLMGWLTGIIFRAIHRFDKTKWISYFAGGLIGGVLNTVLFMGFLVLCFWNSTVIRDMNSQMGNVNVFAFIIGFVGINGLFEFPAACIAGGIVSKALSRIVKTV